jgi:hypothetical protein
VTFRPPPPGAVETVEVSSVAVVAGDGPGVAGFVAVTASRMADAIDPNDPR